MSSDISRNKGRITKFLIIFLIIFLIYSIVNAQISRSRPHSITSKGALSLEEKIIRLDNLYVFASEVKDLEYFGTYRSSGIGPSRYEFHIAVKIEPADTSKWVVNYFKRPPIDGEDELLYKGLDNLDLSGEVWHRSSPPVAYQNGTNIIIVYQSEGILILHLSN